MEASRKRRRKSSGLRVQFKIRNNDVRKSASESQSKSTRKVTTLASLQSDVSANLPETWTLLREQDSNAAAVFCIHDTHPAPTILRSVTVASDLSWHVHVLGKVVPSPLCRFCTVCT